MSSYKHQELDFIHRTKIILEQYKNFRISEKEKFEVTLFINCLVGLLILPQQNWFDNLPTDIVSLKEWGIKEEHISVIIEEETKNVKDIARHLRNSIAHYNFTVFDNSSKEISRIKFEDFDRDNNKTFEATIPILNLRLFTTKLTDTLTKEMNQQN